MDKIIRHLSDKELHSEIGKALRLTKGDATPKAWKAIGEVEGVSLIALYNEANKRKVDKVAFFGHGSWDAYLENKHGFVSLDQKHWSNTRFHYVVAQGIAVHPPKEIDWHAANKTLFAGKSLATWQQMARNSNVSHRAPVKIKFFGKESWPGYVAWIRQKYGGKV
ncbi:MAG: hypothetical protein V1722_01975 [Candidatus Micrarchaeota archaeon]